MSQRKHHKKKVSPDSPLWGDQLNSPDDVLSIWRALAESRKENHNLENRVQQMQAEKIKLEEKCRQMEPQNKHLEETHNEFLMNRQDQQINNTQ